MVQFNFTYTPGVPVAQVIGMEMAGEIWSSFLTDDIEIDIHVESVRMEGNALGGALPGIRTMSTYQEVRGALQADATSENDTTAVGNLRSSSSFAARVFDETIYGQDLSLSRANAKALNLLDASSSGAEELDGVILMNSSANWFYEHSGDTIQADEIDFLSVAMHEIGHVLGFFSGVDQPNWYNTLLSAVEFDDDEIELENTSAVRQELEYATPLDLFRYSRSGSAIDLSIGSDAYFSIDRGRTRLADFATGEGSEFGGDGYQASHWEANSDTGIMDPVIRLAEQAQISDLDLQALDVIGYDINWPETIDLAAAEARAVATVEQASIQVEGEATSSDATSSDTTTDSGSTGPLELFRDRINDIIALIENSGVYDQWGWAQGGGYGQWGWGQGGGYGQWGWGQGGGYGAELFLLAQEYGFAATLADAEGTQDPLLSDSEPAETEAAGDLAGGGSAVAGIASRVPIDELLGLVLELSSRSEDRSGLDASNEGNGVAGYEGELVANDLQQLAATIARLGSNNDILGDLFGYSLFGSMLAEMLPEMAPKEAQELFSGNTSFGGEG